MGADVIPDRLFQLSNGSKGAASQALACDLCEPALDLIQPRSAGRREMDPVTRMLGEPLFHVRVLVGSVVVEDEVNARRGRDRGVDFIEEA